MRRQRTKYGNKITWVDNIRFASELEANRYIELKILLQNGDISDLILQPAFVLQEGFRDRHGKKRLAIRYVADFQYKEGDEVVVEDTKGYKGIAAWRIKEKMFLKLYPQYDFRVIE